MSRFNFTKTFLEGVFIVEPKPICDERGYFERYFCAQDFKEIGISLNKSRNELKAIYRSAANQSF